MLSDLARAQLTEGVATTPAADSGFVPFPRGGPAVSTDLIDRLREEEGV